MRNGCDNIKRKEAELKTLNKIYDKSNKLLEIKKYDNKRKINVFLKSHPYMNAYYNKKLDIFNQNMFNQFSCVIVGNTLFCTTLTFFRYKNKISIVKYIMGISISNVLYYYYFFKIRLNQCNKFYNDTFKEVFFDDYFKEKNTQILDNIESNINNSFKGNIYTDMEEFKKLNLSNEIIIEQEINSSNNVDKVNCSYKNKYF